jgi:serine/threonine protein kinase
MAGAGTLPYMAPELLTARTGGWHEHVTNRVDVYRYSLGVTLLNDDQVL